MADHCQGVDIYHGQGNVDFGRLKAAGVEFVIPKAAQGTYMDPNEVSYVDQARAAGLIVPAVYVWVAPNDTPEFVTLFLAQLKQRGDLAVMLDVETTGVAGDEAIAAYGKVVDMYMDMSEQALGRCGFRYTGKWPVAFVSERQKKWPQVLAGYHALGNGPSIPFWDGVEGVEDWTTRVAIWQYSGNGHVDGCDTPIDLDESAVPAERLANFGRTGVF
jgi:lysozyme